MSWFKKKHTPQRPKQVSPPLHNRVEVELHKEASREAKAQADEANQQLNELLVENGFTLKIYLAAGGHPPAKTKRKTG